MFNLDFYNRTNASVPKNIFGELLPNLKKSLLKAKTVKPADRFLIELSLVGTKSITALNRLHHGKNRSTDVISLSYFDKKMKDPFAGEIFICVPYAHVQAQKIHQSLREELRFLFVHGFLHIFGYDHKKPRPGGVMKKLTYTVLGRK